MNSKQKETLKQRLDENYTAFIASLEGKTVSELVALAPEITAAQQLREELLDACNESDIKFLLQFDDPLELVRGHWEREISGYDHSAEIGHALWEIRVKELYSKEQLTQLLPPRSEAVHSITTDDLRKLEGQEGLILQGCGGDLQEWVDGVNSLLTEAGILLEGSKFETVSTFQHDGITNLLFSFDGVKLDIGKLAMWRIQTHGQFGGTWLSDYVSNRLGGFVQECVQKRPQMQILGSDGNIFAILGQASRLLKDAGMEKQSDKMFQRVKSCGDYYKALHIISEYVETELSPAAEHKKSTRKKGKNAYER